MRAFFFDLDDTLFDHRHSTRTALAALQRQLPRLSSLSIDELSEMHAAVLEQYHVYVLRGEMTVDQARIARLRRLVEAQGFTASDPALKEASQTYREAYLAARRPVPGALPMLRALQPHGPVAVISNNLTEEQTGKIDVCGLKGYIGELVISEAVGLAKPDPAIFRTALERVGARREEAVMIGDSWAADVLGARAAGIRAVWFNPLGRPCPEPGCVTELSAWEPVEDVLEKILE